jgi:hypothetical protein
MKTTRQHFEENLTAEELEKALANTRDQDLMYEEHAPDSALLGAFEWEETTEGFYYWDSIYNRLYNQQK